MIQELNIQNILASILIVYSLILFTMTLAKKQLWNIEKKLIGIFLIAGLAIFSNSWGSYIIAITIIATQITTLDFLLRVLCIIKGTDSNAIQALLVFPSSKEDNEEKYQHLAISEKLLTDSNKEQRTEVIDIIKDSYNKLFDWLQQELGFPVERNVRIKIGDKEWAVDGLVRIGKRIKLLNVKMSLGPAIVYKPFVLNACEKAIEAQASCGLNIELELIFVGNYTQEMIREINNMLFGYKNISSRFITPETIGASIPFD